MMLSAARTYHLCHMAARTSGERMDLKSAPESSAAMRWMRGCVLAVAFAEGEVAERGELEDAAVGVDVRVDAAGAADDVLGAEARVEEIELAEAVEDGEDCGVGADGGSEVFDGLLE